MSLQLLYCSQVGFGWVLFDSWIIASGHLVVVRMIKSRFDEANVTEVCSGPAYAWSSSSRITQDFTVALSYLLITGSDEMIPPAV